MKNAFTIAGQFYSLRFIQASAKDWEKSWDHLHVNMYWIFIPLPSEGNYVLDIHLIRKKVLQYSSYNWNTQKAALYVTKS